MHWINQNGYLMSYLFALVDAHTHAASFVDRILKGASPADLQIQHPTKYSLIINFKTAKALGLTVLPSMLDLAARSSGEAARGRCDRVVR